MGNTKIEWVRGADGSNGMSWNALRAEADILRRGQTVHVSANHCEHVNEACRFCLHPDTPILYADMAWRPIGNAKVGDVLLGFDENPIGDYRLGQRKMRPSVIEAVWGSKQPGRRLITNAAEVVTTAQHRWLRHGPSHWPSTDNLWIGKPLRQIGVERTPPTTEEYRIGYLAGMTLGDGTFRYEQGQRSDKLGWPQAYWRVAMTDEEPLGRLVSYLAAFGVESNIRPYPLYGKPGRPMQKVEVRALGKLATISNLLSLELRTQDYMRGFLAGIFDAEGSNSMNLRISQKDIAVLERAKSYGAALGFTFNIEIASKEDKASAARLTGKLRDRIRFFSAIQPAIARKTATLFGRELDAIADPVVRVEPMDSIDVVDIQTSTHTFFAGGLATHNCYAERGNARLGGFTFKPGHRKLYQFTINRTTLLEPVRRRKPTRIFVESMSDAFGEWWPREFVDQLYAVMLLTQHHTYINLSKRPQRRLDYLADPEMPARVAKVAGDIREELNMGELNMREALEAAPLPNVIEGTSVSCQEEADEFVPILLATRCHVRAVSAEPLLGPIDFTNTHGWNALAGVKMEIDGIVALRKVNWTIIGGESGPKARPFDIDWARNILLQCAFAGTAAFMKQLGEVPYSDGRPMHGEGAKRRKNADPAEWPPELRVREFPIL